MLEHKHLPFTLKAVSDQGIIEGHAATFFTKDLGGDIIWPGAFTKSLRDNSSVPVMLNHRDLAGVSREMREDEKGLFVSAELNLETVKGKEAFAFARQGAIKGLSIGYDAVKFDYADSGEVRNLRELKLWEFSLTPFPMNPEAQITTVKSIEDLENLCRRIVALQRESKAGRRLSAASRDAISAAIVSLQALLAEESESADTGKGAAASSAEPPQSQHSALATLAAYSFSGKKE